VGHSTTEASSNDQTKAPARDLVPDGITGDIVEPRPLSTHRNADEPPEAETNRSRADRIETHRVRKPQDVVGISPLLGSDAGSYITGQIIGGDGVR
jgi:NAD(P)-dependent dehydrogenase (short-subunit alcohol dehydrogenase family)